MPSQSVEDDHCQRKDHRIESDFLQFEAASTTDPHGGKDHAHDREHQVYGNLGNSLPMKPMIEHLDHDRPLASTNLKTSR
jgi:hypothetical protein